VIEFNDAFNIMAEKNRRALNGLNNPPSYFRSTSVGVDRDWRKKSKGDARRFAKKESDPSAL